MSTLVDFITLEKGRRGSFNAGPTSGLSGSVPANTKNCITFVWSWTNVEDVGPALYRCYTIVLCLLQLHFFISNRSNVSKTASIVKYAGPALNKHCVNVPCCLGNYLQFSGAVYLLLGQHQLVTAIDPKKHETLIQCWLDRASIRSTSRVLLDQMSTRRAKMLTYLLGKYWSSFVNDGPTFTQHWLNALFLLWCPKQQVWDVFQIKVMVKAQVYSLISNRKTYHPTVYFTPGHWTCSFVCHFNSTQSIQLCSNLGALSSSYIHITISVLPGTHFHLSLLKHLKVKFLAREHNIETMFQD